MDDGDGRGKQLHIHDEAKIQVQDHGRTAAHFPRVLSQYLAADISIRLVGSSSPRTLAIIDQEILSLDAVIESLQVLRLVKCKARNSLVPISRLPPEILGEIFLTCIPLLDDQDPWNSESNRLDIRLILSQVCTAWRSVAWGLPMLWTTIYCSAPRPEKSGKFAGVLLQWLLRARGLPLSITMDFMDEEAWAKVDTQAPLDILDALMGFCTQWKSLDIVLPVSWQRHLNGFDPTHYVSLQELQIRPLASALHDHDGGIIIEGFRNPPQLSIVSFWFFPYRRLYLAWAYLTHGTFGGSLLGDIVVLLSECLNLVECNIYSPLPDMRTHLVTPIAHFRLRTLKVYLRPIDTPLLVASDILNLLTAPELQHLALRLPLEHSSPLDGLLDLIIRSACQLKSVDVFGPTIREELVTEFLSKSPGVRLYNG